MSITSFKSSLGFAVALGGLVFVSGSVLAQEQPATTPVAKPVTACLQSPAKLDDSAMQSFMNDPAALLTENQSGGLPLSNRIWQIAGSSSSALEKIIAFSKDASDEQKKAIAGGLARVVYSCSAVGTDEANNYGAEIQNMIATSGDAKLAAEYQTASQEVAVAAVGPGTPGFAIGGSPVGGDDGQDGGTNGYRSSGDGPDDTSSGVYDIGSVDTVLSP